MEATARTFRYLDPEEIQAQKAAAKGAKKRSALAANPDRCWAPPLLAGCGGNGEQSCASGWRPARDGAAARHAAHRAKQFHPQDYTRRRQHGAVPARMKLTQALPPRVFETVTNASPDRPEMARRKDRWSPPARYRDTWWAA